MSRLLNSLKEAEKTRKSDAGAGVPPRTDPVPRRREPGYFWTSIALLVLTCGAIVGGYYLVRDALLAAGS